MKKLLIIACLLGALLGRADALMIARGSGGSESSYAVNETFDGTGEPATLWSHYTPTNCTVNYDYATSPAPLEGTQSLRVYYTTGDDCWSLLNFGADYDHVYFQINIPSLPAGNQTPLYFFNSSDSTLFAIGALSTGAFRPFWPTFDSFGDYSISAGTTYHVWVDFTPGTGANAVCDVYFATTSTKPGSATVHMTGGAATTHIRKIQFGAYGTYAIIVDKVVVSSTAIGSAP